MNATEWSFSDRDLMYLVEFFMPNASDKRRHVRMLRKDDETLSGMLADPTLADHLFSNSERIIRASPKLFFAILLHRVRDDISKRSYTFERDTNRMMIIFDTELIVDLLSEEDVLGYLATMLASFAKIHTHAVNVRVRKGIWRRMRFSDFDVEGLVQYLDQTDEEFRFPIYRRIADVSLFTAGVFGQDPEEYLEYGRRYYRHAAAHDDAQRNELDGLLEELADNVEIAAKPLTFMADHYLGTMKNKVFTLP